MSTAARGGGLCTGGCSAVCAWLGVANGVLCSVGSARAGTGRARRGGVRRGDRARIMQISMSDVRRVAAVMSFIAFGSTTHPLPPILAFFLSEPLAAPPPLEKRPLSFASIESAVDQVAAQVCVTVTVTSTRPRSSGDIDAKSPPRITAGTTHRTAHTAGRMPRSAVCRLAFRSGRRRSLVHNTARWH